MEGRDNSSKSEGTDSVLLAMLLKLQSPDSSLRQKNKQTKQQQQKPYGYIEEKEICKKMQNRKINCWTENTEVKIHLVCKEINEK